MQPEEKAASSYRGDRGAAYHREVHCQQMLSERVFLAKAELARYRYFRYLPADARVFEFGAGTGVNLAALEVAERSAFDLSEVALESCERHKIRAWRRLQDVPNGRYHVVVLRHVLEHLANPAQTLVDLAPKLVPGGRLLVVLPVERGRRRPRRLASRDVHRHLFAWKPHHLRNLLDVCGFELTNFHYEWYSMQRLLAWVYRRFGVHSYHAVVSLAGRLRRQSELVAWARRAANLD